MNYPTLEITFLGTGTSGGVPVIGCNCEVCQSQNPKDQRLRSSILVQSPETILVIDTGPDFRQQMLRIGQQKLDAVLYTHPHMDHVLGMDELRSFNIFQDKAMPIYVNDLTLDGLKRIFFYAFEEPRFYGLPKLDVHHIDRESFTVGDLKIQPIHLWHYKMDVIGFRFGDFAYLTDVNKIDEDQMHLLKGVKTLILDALGKVKHISHYSLPEAIDVAKQIGAETTYFTHIGHKMGLYDITEKELPAGMHLAYDGLKIKV